MRIWTRMAGGIGFAVALSVASLASADTLLQSGSLVTDEPNGVAATNQWRSDYSGATDDGFKIAWTITQTSNVNFPIHYKYEITNASDGELKKDLSHLLLEVSKNFTSADISTGVSPDTYSATSQGNSNPGMPGTFWGIKFTPGSGDEDHFIVEFDSTRLPMLGSFYAKDGKSGGPGGGTDVVAWNTGLDPSYTGTKAYLYVPDTKRPDPGPSVPLPASVWGGMALLAGVGVRRWARRA